MKHQTKLVRGDKSNEWESFLKPVCICGWEGKQVSSMNNWQMHDLAKDANTHTFEAAKKEREQCM